MAQEVDCYKSGNVEYEEGPFVIVMNGGYRIEAEFKGEKSNAPALPDSTIYRHLDSMKMNFGKTNSRSVAAEACDYLNLLVKTGHIKLVGRMWVYEPFL